MSGSREATSWLFSQEYNLWFIYDRQHHISVLQDGRRIPGRLQDSPTTRPRTLPTSQRFDTQHQFQTSQDAIRSYTAAGSAQGRGIVVPSTARSTDAGVGILTRQMGAARIAASRQAEGQPSPSGGTVHQSLNALNAPNPQNPQILTGYNAQTRVTSNVQIDAPETFTDPAFQRAGILAHRRLMNSAGDTEALDPGRASVAHVWGMHR